MQDLAELERRISAALDQIGAGLAALTAKGSEPARDTTPLQDSDATQQHVAELDQARAQIAALTTALDQERASRAELQVRLDALADQRIASAPDAGAADTTETVDRLTRQLDVQGIEMVRLRKTVGTLRENLRALRSGQTDGLADGLADATPDAAAINRALLAEVEAMRAERLSEMAELDDILAELDPLIGPVAEETREDA